MADRVGRIRDAQVAEEIAAQAGTEETPPLFLSEYLQPVIFGPQRPPLAASGYFPFTVGVQASAVALNTSQAGVFVSGTNADSIVRVNSITVINKTGGALLYQLRRFDGSGFTIAAVVPGYIDAGNPSAGGVFTAVRFNTVAAQGVLMGTIAAADDSSETYAGPWILNQGSLTVHPTVVNTDVRIYMNCEHWPAIRRQPPG